MNTDKIKLFLVDDDAVFLKSLEIEFMHLPDFIVETYATGELCLKNIDSKPDVVMLSSQDSIEVAISCMHHKAFDYVVKSETAFLRLQKNITTFLHYKKMERELNWYMERM